MNKASFYYPDVPPQAAAGFLSELEYLGQSLDFSVTVSSDRGQFPKQLVPTGAKDYWVILGLVTLSLAGSGAAIFAKAFLKTLGDGLAKRLLKTATTAHKHDGHALNGAYLWRGFPGTIALAAIEYEEQSGVHVTVYIDEPTDLTGLLLLLDVVHSAAAAFPKGTEIELRVQHGGAVKGWAMIVDSSRPNRPS